MRRLLVPIALVCSFAASGCGGVAGETATAPAPNAAPSSQPAAAAAVTATCSEFANQAEAQRAANTRDADHDGIYCESLPCPCSKAQARRPASRAVRRPRGLGPVLLVAPHTRHAGCRTRGALPDPGCSPGAYFAGATRADLCRTGYTRAIRNVPEWKKQRVYEEYGIDAHRPGQYEIDHIVPLTIGGANVIANLYPQRLQPAPGYEEKDRLELAANHEVCSGGASLRALQRQIATDWVALYHELVAP